MEKKDLLKLTKGVLQLEAQALNQMAEKLEQKQIEKLGLMFERLQKTSGQLVFCGVGKSGLIGQKLASTFCSLGLPSFVLHPTEALHGDLGRVRPQDALVYISKSGTTEEIVKLNPFLDIPKENIIGLLGNSSSPVAEYCDVVLDCSVEKEACLNNQAPTTSTTAALAMGDAVAVLYEHLIGLSKEKFAINHPGGLLGKTLRIKVKDVMVKASECPKSSPQASLKEALIEMTSRPLGGLAILEGDKFMGVIVEGDIRRTLTQNPKGLDVLLKEVMNANPIHIGPKARALDALELMENRERPLNILPVIEDEKFVGFIRLHDLIKEGFSRS